MAFAWYMHSSAENQSVTSSGQSYRDKQGGKLHRSVLRVALELLVKLCDKPEI